MKMKKFMRPRIFDVMPSADNSAKLLAHWFEVFNYFLSTLPRNNLKKSVKLSLLINHIAPSIYEYIRDCNTYDLAVQTLKDVYERPQSEVFARHKLLTCVQKGKALSQFMNSLKQLGKQCDFMAVSAVKNRDDYMRDAFICGIDSDFIRQKLLEDKSLTFQTAYDQACSLEQSQVRVDLNNPSQVNIPLKATKSLTFHARENEQTTMEVDESTSLLNIQETKSAATRTACCNCGEELQPSHIQSPNKKSFCQNCNIKRRDATIKFQKHSPKAFATAVKLVPRDGPVSAPAAAAPQCKNFHEELTKESIKKSPEDFEKLAEDGNEKEEIHKEDNEQEMDTEDGDGVILDTDPSSHNADALGLNIDELEETVEDRLNYFLRRFTSYYLKQRFRIERNGCIARNIFEPRHKKHIALMNGIRKVNYNCDLTFYHRKKHHGSYIWEPTFSFLVGCREPSCKLLQKIVYFKGKEGTEETYTVYLLEKVGASKNHRLSKRQSYVKEKILVREMVIRDGPTKVYSDQLADAADGKNIRTKIFSLSSLKRLGGKSGKALVDSSLWLKNQSERLNDTSDKE